MARSLQKELAAEISVPLETIQAILNDKKCCICGYRNAVNFCMECMDLDMLSAFCIKCSNLHTRERLHAARWM